MSLCFSAHSHTIQAKLAQGDLHICPTINIVEGCKDPGYKSCRIHKFSFQTVNSLIKLRSTYKKHCKNTINLQLCQNKSFHIDMYTFSGSVTLAKTCLDESRVSNAHFAGLTWKPNCFWCSMESR